LVSGTSEERVESLGLLDVQRYGAGGRPKRGRGGDYYYYYSLEFSVKGGKGTDLKSATNDQFGVEWSRLTE
jgi:hypothetical protein